MKSASVGNAISSSTINKYLGRSAPRKDNYVDLSIAQDHSGQDRGNFHKIADAYKIKLARRLAARLLTDDVSDFKLDGIYLDTMTPSTLCLLFHMYVNNYSLQPSLHQEVRTACIEYAREVSNNQPRSKRPPNRSLW